MTPVRGTVRKALRSSEDTAPEVTVTASYR
jgi:hypothetical protein